AENDDAVVLPYVYPPHFPHEFAQPRRPRTPPRQHPRRPAVSPPRSRLMDPVATKFAKLSLGDPGASSSSRHSVPPTTVPGTNPVLQRLSRINMPSSLPSPSSQHLPALARDLIFKQRSHGDDKTRLWTSF
ncbi:hypothetical protein Taro_000424, partial [Colocasia esculenta]|nr:hypothetical protein [Colocasia esculenta]